MSGKSVIRMVDIKKSYNLADEAVPILHGIDIEIFEGEYVALMGPSGSGKSTLLNILGCLDTASEGCYYLGGRDVSAMDADELADLRGSLIGFVFQNFNLLAREDAFENVLLPLSYARGARRSLLKNRTERVKTALSAVGLGHRQRHRPNEMSGGERQRVAIARALINDPLVILADEPTGNLDSKSGEQVLEIFRALHAEGRTIVMVTHGEDIAREADRIVRIKDGRIDRDDRVLRPRKR